jgi:hypothetical protein
LRIVRALCVAGLMAVSRDVPAAAFEFAGLSRATTLREVAKRYPNSTVSGHYVHVSPKDAHDHVSGIELFGPGLSSRLRINFEGPDRRHPPCEAIERSVVSRHGPASEVREFREEAAENRYLTWQLELDTVRLQCFKSAGDGRYSAEAIAVYPREHRSQPPGPGAQRASDAGREIALAGGGALTVTDVAYSRGLPHAFHDQALSSLPRLFPAHELLGSRRVAVLGEVVYALVCYREAPASERVVIEAVAVAGDRAWRLSAAAPLDFGAALQQVLAHVERLPQPPAGGRP